MPTTIANIDYTNVCFYYKVLTHITDTPTYKHLKQLKDELKANAGSVQWYLGGGNHGHLGLVLSPDECINVSNTPYIRPLYPGPDPPYGATNYKSTTLQERHHKQIWLFHEANGVEALLISQLTLAPPAMFLDGFQDTHSNCITALLIDILTHLFLIYGAIPEEELDQREQNPKSRVFDLTQPLLHLYNAVEDIQDLATASNNPYTQNTLLPWVCIS